MNMRLIPESEFYINTRRAPRSSFLWIIGIDGRRIQSKSPFQEATEEVGWFESSQR